MNRKKLLNIFFFAIFTGSGLYGIIPEFSRLIPLNGYQQDTTKENQILYNGKMWINLHFYMKGDQFLYSKDFLDGSVTINDKAYETPPGLFLDGVVVKDASVIAGIDPEIVEKIDVVREKYFVGDYLFNGIVNIITKAGDFGNATLPDDAVRLPYKVIDPVWSFVSPDYSSEEMKNGRIPDFRNTLYWNPSVKPDKDGRIGIEFWTSDFTTDYEINIQGITSEGKAFSIKKIIRVK